MSGPTALAIRSDATETIGIGHVMRCVGLAEPWADESGHLFLGRVENDSLVNRIKGNGFQFNPLKAVHPDPDDLTETLRQLTAHRASLSDGRKQVVVLDGYHFDSQYQTALQDPDRTTLVLDDMVHLPRYEADFILNQNCIPENRYYPCDSNARILSGPKFRLIRNEFKRTGLGHVEDSGSGIRLLVFLGGADKRNATLRVIRALKRLEKNPFHAKILVGPVNRNRNQLKTVISESSNRLELLESVPDLAALFAWADLGIAAGGGTCWEMAYMGLPLVLIALNENQSGNVNELCQSGAAVSAGRFDDFCEDAFLDRLEAVCADPGIRADMSLGARGLVDGEGADRVMRIATAVDSGNFGSASFDIRAARKQDIQAVYQLAMDSDVRKNSFSPEPISYAHHIRWFHDKLSRSEDTAFWVLDFEGLVVGQIRYDRQDAEHAEIDFSVHPAFRGLGLGTHMLEQTRKMAVDRLKATRLSGTVVASNEKSRSCFIKSGYTAKNRITIKGRLCQRFEYRQG
jgi:UDP-2,4-diacetamido-2,4,6-trideoxy-beta-L-altropyranose hydrolase